MSFQIYIVDTETTGLDHSVNEVIELSMYRLSDDRQETWYIKPSNYESISEDALRVNRHKLEDLKHLTKEGQVKYRSLSEVLPEIENFMMEDGSPPESRLLVGQNPRFDLEFIKKMWEMENTVQTFPFGKRPFTLDTREIAVFLDLAFDQKSEFYNLGSLVERYKVKKERAHAADADVRMTRDVLLAQLKIVKDLIKK